jgi:hypothetical protein
MNGPALDAIEDFRRSMNALALQVPASEVPAAVWDDVRERWQRVGGEVESLTRERDALAARVEVLTSALTDLFRSIAEEDCSIEASVKAQTRARDLLLAAGALPGPAEAAISLPEPSEEEAV